MNCKLGDIAYIKKAIRKENIGLIVSVVSLLGSFKQGESYMWNGEQFLAYDTDSHWIIESKSGIETQYGKSKQAVIMDSWLIPIRSDETDNLVEDKELILAE
jgi:hypothetical protein